MFLGGVPPWNSLDNKLIIWDIVSTSRGGFQERYYRQPICQRFEDCQCLQIQDFGSFLVLGTRKTPKHTAGRFVKKSRCQGHSLQRVVLPLQVSCAISVTTQFVDSRTTCYVFTDVYRLVLNARCLLFNYFVHLHAFFGWLVWKGMAGMVDDGLGIQQLAQLVSICLAQHRCGENICSFRCVFDICIYIYVCAVCAYVYIYIMYNVYMQLRYVIIYRLYSVYCISYMLI